VFNILLQILDDGRLTDGHGRTVDFKHAIVIMTSNIGSHFMQDTALDDGEKRSRTMELLRAGFKPEFLNRIDDIITFRALNMDDIDRILDLQLSLIQKRLSERRITLTLTDKAKKYMVKIAYSPIYGARPLKRALQKMILDDLSMLILEGTFADGDSVRVDLSKNGVLVFQKNNKM
jgi:ATP-dependent Clp protease ATP-binding subunit ClpB